MTTWTQALAKAMKVAGDTGPVVAVTMKMNDRFVGDPHRPSMDREFDAGFGGSEGDWFTAWTPTRVYFPCVYDGAEWVGSAPRNPCDEATKHIGGE